ncbi:MAG: histidine phosphatase family protein [Pasteurella oralis]|uniref:histidine phosphatase family protein n=1 Tax=Pasteurella oralis TaxID=1071947 RepID=UPI000C79A036|nr:histidine phosphatase family protein [Pasteurella oralis]MDO5054835.1 histidine phosphatase family protein [Pasteurella oralis]
MMKTLRFYLVRHGKTLWNEQGLFQGSGNSPLTDSGIQGAKLTGEALFDTPFIAAYSSTLQRTIDTATYILANRNVPLFQHQGLNEQSFGLWEGQSITQLKDCTEYHQMREDPANYKAQTNGGETYQQLAIRAFNAIRDIIKVHSKGNILIVSHGHTLRILLGLFNGATWQNHREAGKSPALLNTSISIVSYQQYSDEQGRFVIESYNDVTHLNK